MFMFINISLNDMFFNILFQFFYFFIVPTKMPILAKTLKKSQVQSVQLGIFLVYFETESISI